MATELQYHLPPWFITHNVKTLSELDNLNANPKIKLSDEELTSSSEEETDEESYNGDNEYDSETTVDESDDVGKKKNDSMDRKGDGNNPETKANDKDNTGKKKAHFDFQVPSDAYWELHDVIAATLVRDENGALPSTEFSILVQAPRGSKELVNHILMHLAKDMRACLINFDGHDFEDLGCEFESQERKSDVAADSNDIPNRDPINGRRTKHFFAVRSKRKESTKGWCRNKAAVSAILDGCKVTPVASKDSDSTVSIADESAREPSQTLILHLADMEGIIEASNLDSWRDDVRLLARMGNFIQDRRASGVAVVLVLSTFAGSTCDCSLCPKDSPNCRYWDNSRAQTKLSLSKASIVRLVLPTVPEKDCSQQVYTATINIRRLKSILRRRLSHICDPGLLEPLSDWAQNEFGGDVTPLGKALWKEDELRQAATQIIGRAFRKPQLNLGDIRDVLERRGLWEKIKEPDGPEETGTKTTKDDLEISKEESSSEDSKALKEIEPEDPKAWIVTPSKAKQEWEAQKKARDESNEPLDTLMNFIGLESVKTRFMEIKNIVDTARRQNVDLKKERFGTVFIGNPGVGKSKIAEIYASFLSSLQIVPSEAFETTTGAWLANGGIMECKRIIDKVESGGVVFIDEAHQLLSSGGKKILDFIPSQMDRLQGEVVFLFAGYMKPLESFFGYSPGIPSRIPLTIKFDDYDNVELHQILVHRLKEKFGGKMRVEGGLDGVYMRIVAERIGRGRGTSSFGNAREVHNTLNRILYRQANRLEMSRRLDEKGKADDFFLTRTDLIGPPPSATLENSNAWKSLQDMIGLASVKKAVQALIDRLQANYNRELAEQPLVECSLNKVFLGNPGTGKTTVAKYYGQILVDIGLLSNGEVVVKNPSDFMGQAIGETESITKGILESTRGKVLIIDEAYALSSASDETSVSNPSNPYKTAIVDTIVAEVQSTASDDRCVLLLGYEERMIAMLQDVNPALSRRFPISSAFKFEDYTEDELRQILDQQLNAQGFTASEQAKEAAIACLERARNHKNFGNAGEVDILLDRAKELQQRRVSSGTNIDIFQLEPQDFDIDFDRADRAEANIRQLFSDFVGAEALIEKLESYQRVAQNSKALDLDPREQLPFNFLFRGPPGTGKTTTAKRIGQVFYDIGLVATNEVINCSATDLIGEYLGQTGPKTQKVFQKALGKVLLIDEAYLLADGGRYGNEAVVEMMNLLTKDQYRNKMITILAGYDEDINKLIAINPGFSSRFPEVLNFAHLTPSCSCTLLLQCLQNQKLDVNIIQANSINDKMIQLSFKNLAGLPGWGNARDIQTLATAIYSRIMKSQASPPVLVVTEKILYTEINQMIIERQKRAEDAESITGGSGRRKRTNAQDYRTGEKDSTPIAPVTKTKQAPHDHNHVNGSEPDSTRRDPGVSDEVWEKLQKAKTKSKERFEEDDDSDEETEGDIQRRLMDCGLCEMGYAWIKEETGYRCAGGSHFMSNAQIENLC